MAEKALDRDADVLKRQITLPSAKVRIWTLYRYATVLDYAILVGGTICAIAGGAALPLMSVIFGKLAGIFLGAYGGEVTSDELTDKTRHIVLYFVYLCIGEFVTVTLSTLSFIYVGERLSCQIREHFLEGCLRQNIGFYDVNTVGEITTRIAADTNLVQEAKYTVLR
jgi:ATP-binding cassette subfamily B (MDR/TAP) protein 1